MDLFDDLPEPVNNGSSSGDTDSVEAEGENRGEKRKVECANDQNKRTDLHEAELQTVLRGYATEMQGERDDMQDAHVVIDNFGSQIEHLAPEKFLVALYIVCDGHGGARASKYAAANLPANLVQKFPKGDFNQVEKDIGKCLVDVYKKTDEDFLREAATHKPTWKDGTTAVTVLAVNNTLYIANLGDSKAVLCRYNAELGRHVSIPLSRDHTPIQYEERMRIQKSGGTVRDGRVMGILEVSRSIGDGQYKTCGIISTPDIKRCQLTENDRFVMLACDGLWKVFAPDEAINFVMDILEDWSETSLKDKKAVSEDAKFEAACMQLTKEAVRKGSGDNVTVVIVAIDRCIARKSNRSIL